MMGIRLCILLPSKAAWMLCVACWKPVATRRRQTGMGVNPMMLLPTQAILKFNVAWNTSQRAKASAVLPKMPSIQASVGAIRR